MVGLLFQELHWQKQQVDSSGGMYAWGQLLTFSAVFGPLALVPSGLALYFLRRSNGFRIFLSYVSIPLGLSGFASFVLNAWVFSQGVQQSLMRDLALLGILRMYPAPMVFLHLSLPFCFPRRPLSQIADCGRRPGAAGSRLRSVFHCLAFVWVILRRIAS